MLFHGARGSITETQSHLEYGKRVGYIKELEHKRLDDNLISLYNDINKIVVTLKKSNKK